jgi:hypothetical protein
MIASIIFRSTKPPHFRHNWETLPAIHTVMTFLQLMMGCERIVASH